MPTLKYPRDSNDMPSRARRIKRPEYRGDPMSHATGSCTDATARSYRHNNNNNNNDKEEEDTLIWIWEASWKSGPS